MRSGIACGVLAGAVWGGVFLVPALLAGFPPLWLSCARYLMYGAFSLVLAWPVLPRLLARLQRGDVWLLVEFAVTGNLLYYLGVASAVQLAGVAPTALIVGTTPVVITLLGRHDAGAAPLKRLLGPLALVLLGVACINVDVLWSPHAQQQPLGERVIGMVCAAGSVLSWSWFAVRNARFLKSQTRFDSQQWSLLWGMVTGVLGGLVWLTALAWPGLPPAATFGHADWIRFWGLNLALAVACSWFGNWMWNLASTRLPLTLSGQMLVFETSFALLYGLLWAGRWPSVLEMASLALLVSGVALAARRHTMGTPSPAQGPA